MPMEWQKLLSSQRLIENQKLSKFEEPLRSPFHKDQDKILFSSAFRRLEKKTQAQPFPMNDHAHSRLTHSLEVSCVGRSLGTRVGFHVRSELPENITPQDVGAIVQAACLAHDIGNPPFGHTGEDAMRQWFSYEKNAPYLEGLSEAQSEDFRTFEGNAQGLRVITQHEYHRFEGGMHLTLATLGAFLKYPWTVNHKEKGKFGCYQSELPILKAITKQLGLIAKKDDRWVRHPLAYLMEAADDICYALLDLEDGVEMGLISQEEVETLLAKINPEGFSKKSSTKNTKLSLMRGPVFEALVEEIADTFNKHEKTMLKGEFEGDIISMCKSDISDSIKKAKTLAHEKIFQNEQKMTVEIGAYATLSGLLDLFIGAVDELLSGKSISYRHDRALKMIGRHAPEKGWDKYEAYQRIVDYIGGMTDQFAINLAQHVRGLRY